MSIHQFYYARKEFPSYGNLHFLKVAQRADSPGGGESLLGSVVERRSSGWLFSREHFPAPRHLLSPRLVTLALDERRKELGLEQEVLVQTTTFAGFSGELSISRDQSFGLGVEVFPSLPQKLGIDVDYKKMVKVVLSFGAGTKLRYIPAGYLAHLYRSLSGDPQEMNPALSKHFIVNRVLLAKELTVQFESSEKLGSKLEATVSSGSPVVNGSTSVRYEKLSNSAIAATVKGTVPYLVALGARSWDEFGEILD